MSSSFCGIFASSPEVSSAVVFFLSCILRTTTQPKVNAKNSTTTTANAIPRILDHAENMNILYESFKNRSYDSEWIA